MRSLSKIISVTSIAVLTLSLSSCAESLIAMTPFSTQDKTTSQDGADSPLVMPADDARAVISGSFWQELPEGGKVQCILTTGSGTNSSGLSCDWNQSMGKYAEADEKR